MRSSLERFWITLLGLGFASILPAMAGAQPPIYLTQWGSQGSGNGEFNEPAGVAIDAAGDIYVADAANSRIQKFTGTGTYITQWGALGYVEGYFVYPFDVATNSAGDVYVSDYGYRIQKFTGAGTYLTQWGSYGSGDGQFNLPTGLAIDAADNIFVADYFNLRIQKFSSTGTYLTQWGSQGSGEGQFNSPREVATDAAGNVYVVDQTNHRIQKFTGTGAYLTQWGSFGTGDGQFNAPNGVAVDAAGNVYVADTFNNRIQKFTGTGTYLTQWGSSGSGNGQLASPVGLVTDASGNIYVVDSGNHRVQKFGPAPVIAIAFDFNPNTLNLASQGRWVTGFLEPPSPHAAGDIDISSIRLNGTVPVDPSGRTAIGDHDGNGILDLMVKFSRSSVELALSEGDNIPIEVTGTFGSDPFVGIDHIRVIRAVVSAPVAGSRLTAGSVTQVRWQMPSGITVESVGLLHSLDSGRSWSLIASRQPNTGSYEWTVPNVHSDQCKVAVVESADDSGAIVDGVLGVSDAFLIQGTLDVSGENLVTHVLPPRPNPSGGSVNLGFSIARAGVVEMSVFDTQGRLIATPARGPHGAGIHHVIWDGRLENGGKPRAGLYFVRMRAAGQELRERLVRIE